MSREQVAIVADLVAFGERHPDNPAMRTAYERAHRRLHGRYPQSCGCSLLDGCHFHCHPHVKSHPIGFSKWAIPLAKAMPELAKAMPEEGLEPPTRGL